jgi:hypothetical protein
MRSDQYATSSACTSSTPAVMIQELVAVPV